MNVFSMNQLFSITAIYHKREVASRNYIVLIANL